MTPTEKLANKLDARVISKKEMNDMLMNAINRLDEKLWAHFKPEWNGEFQQPEYLGTAVLGFKVDIEEILVDAEDYDATLAYILDAVLNERYGEKILDLIKVDSIKENVKVRKDFASALRKVKKGDELSSVLEWMFSPKDIKELAKLHKSNKFRKKIEDLLTDCNFHCECADFANGKYAIYTA